MRLTLCSALPPPPFVLILARAATPSAILQAFFSFPLVPSSLLTPNVHCLCNARSRWVLRDAWRGKVRRALKFATSQGARGRRTGRWRGGGSNFNPIRREPCTRPCVARTLTQIQLSNYRLVGSINSRPRIISPSSAVRNN